MDNPKKLATLGTQDEGTQNKTHSTVSFGHHYLQTTTSNVNKPWPSYKPL
jgi:hypothetical protein